tara:strand:+ start:26031 stop:26708 length:678 start_codon:yes stop_codon:yes gene_type:complete
MGTPFRERDNFVQQPDGGDTMQTRTGLNRRKALASGLAALALTATATSRAVAQAVGVPHAPVQRVNALARELSQAMDEWVADIGGQWRAQILPASSSPCPVIFESLDETSELQDLFDRWEMAGREWLRLACSGGDWEGPEMTDLQDEQWRLTTQIGQTPARSLHDLALLARVLWDDFGPDSLDPGEQRDDPQLRLKWQILMSADRLANLPEYVPVNDCKFLPSEF